MNPRTAALNSKTPGQQGLGASETKYDWERVLDACEKLFAEMR